MGACFRSSDLDMGRVCMNCWLRFGVTRGQSAGVIGGCGVGQGQGAVRGQVTKTF